MGGKVELQYLEFCQKTKTPPLFSISFFFIQSANERNGPYSFPHAQGHIQ